MSTRLWWWAQDSHEPKTLMMSTRLWWAQDSDEDLFREASLCQACDNMFRTVWESLTWCNSAHDVYRSRAFRSLTDLLILDEISERSSTHKSRRFISTDLDTSLYWKKVLKSGVRWWQPFHICALSWQNTRQNTNMSVKGNKNSNTPQPRLCARPTRRPRTQLCLYESTTTSFNEVQSGCEAIFKGFFYNTAIACFIFAKTSEEVDIAELKAQLAALTAQKSGGVDWTACAEDASLHVQAPNVAGNAIAQRCELREGRFWERRARHRRCGCEIVDSRCWVNQRGLHGKIECTDPSLVCICCVCFCCSYACVHKWCSLEDKMQLRPSRKEKVLFVAMIKPKQLQSSA